MNDYMTKRERAELERAQKRIARTDLLWSVIFLAVLVVTIVSYHGGSL